MQKQEQTVPLRTLVGGLAAGLVVLVAGCNPGGAEEPPPTPPVEVVMGTGARIQVEDRLTAVGTLQANERLEIQPETPGLIEAIPFTEGQRVERGQTLFELNSRKEEAAVAKAQAELELAQSNLDRARTLVGTKAISLQELDKLASELAVKSAALNVQKENLADRVLTAPFNGVVGPRRVSPGQYVSAGTQLGTLVDDSTMKALCGVPERGLAHVRVGQVGRLRVNTFPDRWFTGKVDLISPEVDGETRMAEVRLVVPNPESLLRPGMFARVELIVSVRPDALVIPESALVPSMEGFSVYVVQEGRARLISVKIGVRLPGQVEIVDGLGFADQLVLSGVQKLVEGMSVVAGSEARPPTTGSGVTAAAEDQP